MPQLECEASRLLRPFTMFRVNTDVRICNAEAATDIRSQELSGSSLK
jgi:hypothetical protein